jgi:hypothetical protein
MSSMLMNWLLNGSNLTNPCSKKYRIFAIIHCTFKLQLREMVLKNRFFFFLRLGLTKFPRLVLNSQSSYHTFPCSWIIGKLLWKEFFKHSQFIFLTLDYIFELNQFIDSCILRPKENWFWCHGLHFHWGSLDSAWDDPLNLLLH